MLITHSFNLAFCADSEIAENEAKIDSTTSVPFIFLDNITFSGSLGGFLNLKGKTVNSRCIISQYQFVDTNLMDLYDQSKIITGQLHKGIIADKNGHEIRADESEVVSFYLTTEESSVMFK